jgi:hypothetical protein
MSHEMLPLETDGKDAIPWQVPQEGSLLTDPSAGSPALHSSLNVPPKADSVAAAQVMALC